MTSVASLIVVLGVLIFVHELGHFLAAKAVGVFVHRFSLGLGAPIRWLTFTRKGTEYSISWLPLGGYVKMASQEEEVTSSALEGARAQVEVPVEQTFEAKPVWKRMIIILAGVTMNVLFAWLVLSWLALDNGRQIDPTTTVGLVADSLPPGAEALAQLEPGDRITSINGVQVRSWNEVMDELASAPEPELIVNTANGKTAVLAIHPDALEARLGVVQALAPWRDPVAGEVDEAYPAAAAGVQPGDTIVAVAGSPIRTWYDLSARLQEVGARPVELVVGRAAGRDTLRITPVLDTVPLRRGQDTVIARIGVTLAEYEYETEPYGLGGALAAGWEATWGLGVQTFRSVKGLVSGRISGRNLGGPILIGQMAGQTAQLGLDAFLHFMALISVNLAILNMLPIPVLDGGQFLFLLAEAVIRRPLPLRLRELLTMVGMVLIVLLMVYAFSNDIMRLIGA
jgi:regulator of sigma E protease